jgi:hypothetical protein
VLIFLPKTVLPGIALKKDSGSIDCSVKMKKAVLFCHVAAAFLVAPCSSFFQRAPGIAPLHSYGRPSALANDVSATLETTSTPSSKNDGGELSADVVICGGGPAGLLR